MPAENPVIISTSGFVSAFGTWLITALSNAWNSIVRITSVVATDAGIFWGQVVTGFNGFITALPAILSGVLFVITNFANQVFSIPIIASIIQTLSQINGVAFGWLRPIIARIPILSRILVAIAGALHPAIGTLLQTIVLIAALPYLTAVAAGAFMFVYSWPMEFAAQAIGNVITFFKSTAQEIYAAGIDFIQVNHDISNRNDGFVSKSLQRTWQVCKVLVSPVTSVIKQALYLIGNTIILPFTSAFTAFKTSFGAGNDVLNISIFRRIRSPWQNIFGSSAPAPTNTEVAAAAKNIRAINKKNLTLEAKNTENVTNTNEIKEGLGDLSTRLEALNSSVTELKQHVTRLEGEISTLKNAPLLHVFPAYIDAGVSTEQQNSPENVEKMSESDEIPSLEDEEEYMELQENNLPPVAQKDRQSITPRHE